MTLVKVEMLHKVRITQGLRKKCVSYTWNVVLYGYYVDTKLNVKETFGECVNILSNGGQAAVRSGSVEPAAISRGLVNGARRNS